VSDAVHERLLEAAVELFTRLGVAAVSVGDICRHAGVPKGSFYHAWPSKHALLLEAIDRYVTDHTKRLRQALDPALPVREQLRRAFSALQTVHENRKRAAGGVMPGCTTENLVMELAARDEEVRVKLAAVFEGWRNEVEGLLRDAVERGELTLDDPGATARALLAAVQGATILARTSNDPAMVAAVGNAFVALLPE
jgi:TetR/AcrR family transcriptional repressor of nem operon